MPIGAATIAVAVLFSTSDRVIVTTISAVRIAQAGQPSVSQISDSAIRVVPPEVFLDALAAEYAQLETQFQTYGFAPIRTAWLSHAARLGEEIVARTMKDETRGVFEDVDAQGNLILRTPKGRVPITAADVFF